MLEICRSHPPSLHLAAHPQVRDNIRGERVPSEHARLCAAGFGQVLVHRTALHSRSHLHPKVLCCSHLRRKVLRCSLGAAARFPVFLRLALALPAAADKSGFQAVLSAELPPKVWAGESLDEDGESETGASAAAEPVALKPAVSA
jgi:hypothetical protein